MTKIIFVCYGNICRSVAAEFVLKQLIKEKGLTGDVSIISRGISNCEQGSDTYPLMKEVLEKNNIEITRHIALGINADEIKNATYVLCMEQFQIDFLKRKFYAEIKDFSNVYLISAFSTKMKGEQIADPYYSLNFELAFKQIYYHTTQFLNYLINKGILK